MKMTEKEKMLASQLYNSRDPELIEMYHNARRLLRMFNTAESHDADAKTAALTELFGKLGKNVWIEAPFFCDYGENIVIGDNTFINFNAIFLDCNRISIGKNGLIGPNVQIYTAHHPLKASDRIKQNWDETDGTAIYHTAAAPVTIGDNVWIGGSCIVFPGVSIGDNTTIGAGSIVTKNIPANVLAFGNPCKVVRQL